MVHQFRPFVYGHDWTLDTAPLSATAETRKKWFRSVCRVLRSAGLEGAASTLRKITNGAYSREALWEVQFKGAFPLQQLHHERVAIDVETPSAFLYVVTCISCNGNTL